MVYIVGDTATLTDTIEVFTYEPSDAGPYTITYSVVIPGDPVGSLAITGTNDGITVGLEPTGTAAVHTATLTGTLSHSSAITATTDFTLTIVTLAGTLAD